MDNGEPRPKPDALASLRARLGARLGARALGAQNYVVTRPSVQEYVHKRFGKHQLQLGTGCLGALPVNPNDTTVNEVYDYYTDFVNQMMRKPNCDVIGAWLLQLSVHAGILLLVKEPYTAYLLYFTFTQGRSHGLVTGCNVTEALHDSVRHASMATVEDFAKNHIWTETEIAKIYQHACTNMLKDWRVAISSAHEHPTVIQASLAFQRETLSFKTFGLWLRRYGRNHTIYKLGLGKICDRCSNCQIFSHCTWELLRAYKEADDTQRQILNNLAVEDPAKAHSTGLLLTRVQERAVHKAIKRSGPLQSPHQPGPSGPSGPSGPHLPVRAPGTVVREPLAPVQA